MKNRTMQLALLLLLVGCTDQLTEPEISLAPEVTTRAFTANVMNFTAQDCGESRNTIVTSGILCAWPVVFDANDDPSDYYVQTGIRLPARHGGGIIHRIHNYIHGDLATFAYSRNYGWSCWAEGSTPSEGKDWPWPWGMDNYCEQDFPGDEVLEVQVGWPECVTDDIANSFHEIKPGKRRRGFGAKAQARVCG